MKDNARKDLRLKPANLRLKRSQNGGKSKRSSGGDYSREAFAEPSTSSSTADNGGAGNGSSSSTGGGFLRLYWLNGSATRLHNVRSEPIKESAVVGHLVEDKQVKIN